MKSNAPNHKSGRGAGGRAAGQRRGRSTTKRFERLIDQQVEKVATTAEHRHDTLLRAAFTVGGVLHAAETPPEQALELLASAAESAGLPHAEAVRTAHDGLQRGAERPLDFRSRHTFQRARPLRARPLPTPLPDPGKRALALELWARVNRDDRHVSAHPYCQKKLVRHAFGAGRVTHKGRDLLCVPVKRDGVGELLAVQTIDPDGQKRTYGRLEDAYLLLGDERDTSHEWVACEGWATAHAVSGSLWRLRRPAPVLVAFGASRLGRVATATREAYGASIRMLEDGELWA